jgi:hypothetical protein
VAAKQAHSKRSREDAQAASLMALPIFAKRIRRLGRDPPPRPDFPAHAARSDRLYSGVTRGKRLVVLVGQKKAIAIAVRNGSGRRRWSKLEEWLRLGAARDSLAASQFG